MERTETTITHSYPAVPHGVVSVGDAVWVLCRGAPLIVVRSAKRGEVIAKVELLEEGVAIGNVGPRVWVSTVSNKLFVFSATDRSLLGAIQPTGLPTVRRFVVLRDDLVFSIGDGKDFYKWDAQQFSVERTFLGEIPGETVASLALADVAGSMIVVGTSHATRLYSTTDGTVVSSVHTTAPVLCVVPGDGRGGGAPVDRSVVRMNAEGSTDRTHASTTQVWAAQPRSIVVYSLQGGAADGQARASLVRDRYIDCPRVSEMFLVSPGRVCTVDETGRVVLWDANKTATPLRTLDVPTSSAPEASSFSLIACRLQTVVVWSFIGTEATVWTDEVVSSPGTTRAISGADPEGNTGDVSYLKDLERDEIQFLRRKIKYQEDISQLYRTKVRGLVPMVLKGGPSNKASTASPEQLQGALSEIEKLYDRALKAWDTEQAANEPLPAYAPPTKARTTSGAAASPARTPKGALSPDGQYHSSSEFVEYWKSKHAEVARELDELRVEHDKVLTMMQDHSLSASDADIRRAQHICQVIKEKNTLRERERLLAEDVARLRGKLREYSSPLGSTNAAAIRNDDPDVLKEENLALREEVTRLQVAAETATATSEEVAVAKKHAQVLKDRVRKLRTELDEAQRELAEASTRHQGDIDRLLGGLAAAQKEAETERQAATAAEEQRSEASRVVSACEAEVRRYRSAAELAERELSLREDAERAAQTEVRNEIKMLCASLDDRDKRLAQALEQVATMEQERRSERATLQAAQARLAAQDAETEVLHAHIAQLETATNDRRQYARTVGELQGRMEMAVEQLRRSFTPEAFAGCVTSLEERMANLIALEAQLRQKDDIIAIRDDQILTLQQHLLKVETQMSEVSSVFLHLPRSIEEVELLMVECDEYRRRLGMDAEMQELVQIRLLEVQAKRRAGEPVPLLADVTPDPTKPGKSALEAQRLQTLGSVARSLAKDDRTGIVHTSQRPVVPEKKATTPPTPTPPATTAPAPETSPLRKPTERKPVPAATPSTSTTGAAAPPATARTRSASGVVAPASQPLADPASIVRPRSATTATRS